ncbi:hypothetical protein AA313_de0209649 [Arthrobotrys entomopaga]|nr:hypothetical protein AA313_de0209649 [Arthrobotrys entomopaga]
MELEGPINSNRPIRVVIVGAGASGLLMAYKLQRNFDDVEIQIYDKNLEIGGTWYENKYPGCACDTPSHTYVWSFDPNPNWSANYASSAEILAYFKSFQFKHNLQSKTLLNHTLSSATWHPSCGQWRLEIQDTANNNHTKQDTCDILINATGVLNDWKWPDIPGLHSFNGPLVHTAKWDEKLDIKDKHVGLIGNGSSGMQVLPAILPEVSKCTTFIREPTWVLPFGPDGTLPRKFNDEEREAFAAAATAEDDGDGEELYKFRRWLEHRMNRAFPIFINDSPFQKGVREACETHMRSVLQDGYLEDKIIPEWAVGCRRLTPGIGFLEALKDEKTKVVFEQIVKITSKGCVTADRVEHSVDIIICATGFNTSFVPRFRLVGSHGYELAEQWKHEPRSYLGVAAAGFPNYFMFIGPNSPIGNGPVLIGIEAQADYICRIITRIQQHGIKSIQVKTEAVDDFIAHKDQFMERTVWQEDCKSWYKRGTADGKITALWPGSTLHYLECLKDVRYEDYHVEYFGNRFSYLGNGMTRLELTEDADLATYIRKKDDGPIIGSKFTYTKATAELEKFSYALEVIDQSGKAGG